MVLIIRQLWDGKLGRPVRVEDVSSQSLEYVEKLSFMDRHGDKHTYRLYEAKKDRVPYDNEYTHYKNRVKVADNEPPFRIYKRQTTQDGAILEPDQEHLTHQFHTRWGGGCFRGFFLGGQPPFEQFYPPTWIEKVT